MAKGRGGSQILVNFGLGILGLAWVLTLIMAIMFKNAHRDSVIHEEEANRKLRVFVKGDEESSQAVEVVRQRMLERKGSVVGGLLEEIELLKKIVNNKPGTSVVAIQKEMESHAIDLGKDLMSEITRLQAESSSDKELIAQLEEMGKKSQENLTRIEKEKIALGQKFQDDVSDLRNQLATVQDDYNAFRERVKKDLGGVEGRIKEIQDHDQQRINELRSTIDQKDDQIAVLNRRIKDLEVRHKSGGDIDSRTMPDGSITAILSEEKWVYIDRGDRDHIRLGMTFEIYDKGELIKLNDQFQDLKGKATVEVINISENSAVCRIVRQDKGKVINEGDQIANVVYDPQARYTFFVYGEFDIDGTGVSSVSDRRRIETMILQWNGKLGSSNSEGEGRLLSYDVDYLVLGVSPETPEQMDPNTVDPEIIAEHVAKVKKYEQYQKLITEAKQLSIPILNQNRFLQLVGYYRR